MKKVKTQYILAAFIFILVVAGIAHNTVEKLSVDRSKLPSKVEDNTNFQRWITNLKNKGLDFIEADEFYLVEENEVYNTKWIKIYSNEDKERMDELEADLKNNRNIDKIIYAPSERLYLDYRDQKRGEYGPNQALLHGIRDDKIIDARILDCSLRANCYFDRAYFLSNDVFVISELSRDISKKDENPPVCTADDECAYTFKIHLIDLINNSRLVYESEPFNIVLSEVIPEL